LFVVFGVTGSTSVSIVRPALHQMGLQGSMKEGPWSYRIGSFIVVSPIYACILLGVGTLAGRHAFAAKMFHKIMGRFLPASVNETLTCAPAAAAAAAAARTTGIASKKTAATRLAAAAATAKPSSLRGPESSSAPPTEDGSIGSKLMEVVKSAPVVVFSSPTCPFCRATVDLLEEEGIEYVALNVDYDHRMALKELTTQSSVPSIWIGGKFVGGYGDGPEDWMGLKKLYASGTLHQMVDDANKA